jgi:hypothetical protein
VPVLREEEELGEMTDQVAATSVTVTVPRKANAVFQLQNLAGTDVWVLVEKPELMDLVEKARLYDMESHERLSYEADKISREYALEHPIGLSEMIAAEANARQRELLGTKRVVCPACLAKFDVDRVVKGYDARRPVRESRAWEGLRS